MERNGLKPQISADLLNTDLRRSAVKLFGDALGLFLSSGFDQ
jgi:hypothetical protein